MTATAGRPARNAPGPPPHVVVLGDAMIDIVFQASEPLRPSTDVPGRVLVRAGGSAANTARWLARLGLRTTLIGAVGRDPAGRALGAALRADGVRFRVARPAGSRTGRIGVLVAPDGERSFVADRGAADDLRPGDLRPSWLAVAVLLHLPAYSLLGEPLRLAALRAIDLVRASGAAISLDLASAAPLLAGGAPAAVALVRTVAPDLLFATAAEALALGDRGAAHPAAGDEHDPDPGPLLDLAPVVVLKRGAAGATVLSRSGTGPPWRVEVPVRPVTVRDTTGAGDAFDAGFIAAWLRLQGGAPRGAARRPPSVASLRRAALAGHRTARRQLTNRIPELRLL